MIGTVYKIEIGENIYIGSTILKLNDRQANHNFRLKKNIRKNKLYNECRKHNITKIICILLEEKEVENKEEIRMLEQEYITKLQPTLNSNIAYTGLTQEEYNKEYNEKNKEKNKKWRDNNKDKISQQKKEYYEINRDTIREYKKEHYEKNKDELLKKK